MTQAPRGMIPLRERTNGEASDAGILLYARLLPRLLFFRVPFTLTAAGLLFFLFPQDNLWIAALILWWIRPLGDRLTLFPLSRLFFGHPLFSREALAQGVNLLTRGLLFDLTLRRLSPFRFLLMPLRGLEGLKGPRQRKRAAGLLQGQRSTGLLLSGQMLTTEILLLGFGMAFLAIMETLWLPEGSSFLFREGRFIPLLYCFWVIQSLFLTPLAVCSGFTLYINSRVIQEGWDLEIAIRGLPLVLLAAALLLAVPAPGLTAQEEKPISPLEAYPQESLEKVLSSPDFGKEVHKQGFRIKEGLFDQDRESSPGMDLSRWEGLMEAVRRVISTLPLLAAIGVGIFLLVFLLKRLSVLRRIKSSGTEEEIRLPFSPAEKEPPPAARELYTRAQGALEEGDIRRVWSLLYRGMVRLWEEREGLDFGREATEEECLETAESHRDRLPVSEQMLFKQICRLWMKTAYGGEPASPRACRENLELVGRLLEGSGL